MPQIMKEVLLIETKSFCRAFIPSEDLYFPFIDLGREAELSSTALNPMEAEELI